MTLTRTKVSSLSAEVETAVQSRRKSFFGIEPFRLLRGSAPRIESAIGPDRLKWVILNLGSELDPAFDINLFPLKGSSWSSLCGNALIC
jgi:hypothetical protein